MAGACAIVIFVVIYCFCLILCGDTWVDCCFILCGDCCIFIEKNALLLPLFLIKPSIKFLIRLVCRSPVANLFRYDTALSLHVVSRGWSRVINRDVIFMRNVCHTRPSVLSDLFRRLVANLWNILRRILLIQVRLLVSKLTFVSNWCTRFYYKYDIDMSETRNLNLRGPKVRSFGQWAAATCAAPPSVIAGQYTPLLIVNRCWSCSCKWRYINVNL